MRLCYATIASIGNYKCTYYGNNRYHNTLLYIGTFHGCNNHGNNWYCILWFHNDRFCSNDIYLCIPHMTSRCHNKLHCDPLIGYLLRTCYYTWTNHWNSSTRTVFYRPHICCHSTMHLLFEIHCRTREPTIYQSSCTWIRLSQCPTQRYRDTFSLLKNKTVYYDVITLF